MYVGKYKGFRMHAQKLEPPFMRPVGLCRGDGHPDHPSSINVLFSSPEAAGGMFGEVAPRGFFAPRSCASQACMLSA